MATTKINAVLKIFKKEGLNIEEKCLMTKGRFKKCQSMDLVHTREDTNLENISSNNIY